MLPLLPWQQCNCSPDLRQFLQFICYLEGWQWCLWLASFAPIYYGAGLCVHLVELGVESRFLTSRSVMYYAVSIKVRWPGTMGSCTQGRCLLRSEPLAVPPAASCICSMGGCMLPSLLCSIRRD